MNSGAILFTLAILGIPVLILCLWRRREQHQVRKCNEALFLELFGIPAPQSWIFEPEETISIQAKYAELTVEAMKGGAALEQAQNQTWSMLRVLQALDLVLKFRRSGLDVPNFEHLNPFNSAKHAMLNVHGSRSLSQIVPLTEAGLAIEVVPWNRGQAGGKSEIILAGLDQPQDLRLATIHGVGYTR